MFSSTQPSLSHENDERTAEQQKNDQCRHPPTSSVCLRFPRLAYPAPKYSRERISASRHTRRKPNRQKRRLVHIPWYSTAGRDDCRIISGPAFFPLIAFPLTRVYRGTSPG